jgi:bifunctional ADP-heptose synthase (sugar kinase/adenylyltransferase)
MKNTTITIQETTNKSIIKFVSNQILINGGSYEFNNIDEAKNSSLAQQLFYLPFVKKFLLPLILLQFNVLISLSG